MSKICAKCEKPVYPLEELKCLDKIWHKGCFKCWECGMSLNMKNYKGFDRKPYCSAHYPQTKATVVADTPELQRLSQTSKIQSQTAYRNEFETSKGKYTQIADDPELARLLRNQETISMAKYHEEFEKKIKGSKIQVADDPETQRLKQLSSVVSQVEYKGLREKNMDMEARRQNVSQPEVPEKSFRRPDNYPSENQKPSPYSDRSVSHSTVYGADGRVMESQSTQRKIGSIADYDPTNYSSTLPHSSLRQTQEWEETVVFSPQNFPSQPCNNQASSGGELRYSSLERPAPAGTDGISSSMVGNRDVKPYDGAAVTGGQPVASSDLAEDQQYLAQQQQILQQQQDPQQQQVRWQQQQQQQQQYAQQQQMREQQQQQQQQMREQQQQQQLREQQLKEQQLREQQLREQQQQQMEQRQFKEQQMREQQLLQQQRQQQNDELSAQTAQNVQHSRKLAAMYDYDAQDDDEVSFMENDLVVNCDPIDEGWMYGTIQRTGQRGMLPANYVERVQ